MKKGFTLVELLAVIVVIGIIATIGVASVSGVINASKQGAYEEQVRKIEKTAREWAVENTNQLPDMTEGSTPINVSLEMLKSSGKLPKIPEDPRTGTAMTGSVVIAYDYSNNQYTYTYSE